VPTRERRPRPATGLDRHTKEPADVSGRSTTVPDYQHGPDLAKRCALVPRIDVTLNAGTLRDTDAARLNAATARDTDAATPQAHPPRHTQTKAHPHQGNGPCLGRAHPHPRVASVAHHRATRARVRGAFGPGATASMGPDRRYGKRMMMKMHCCISDLAKSSVRDQPLLGQTDGFRRAYSCRRSSSAMHNNGLPRSPVNSCVPLEPETRRSKTRRRPSGQSAECRSIGSWTPR